MDQAFIELYGAFFGGTTADWGRFEAVAVRFFAESSVGPTQHDAFFENFSMVWQRWVQAGRLAQAEELWKVALGPVLAWEFGDTNRRVHKGTPYYFWGMTAILRGDLDKGYALMHQAVEEDVLTYRQDSPPSPAFAFATLNAMKPDQAFRGWLLDQAKLVSNFLDSYSRTTGRSFDFNGFQQRFLANGSNRDASFLLAHALARLMNLVAIPDYARDSRFASQLQIQVLFDVTLVIDAAIRPYNLPEWKFIKHAALLAQRGGLGLTREQLGKVNGLFESDFEATLKGFLDEQITLADGSVPKGLVRDICVAYGLRNYGAHQVTPATSLPRRFEECAQRIFNVLFLSVEMFH
jgi:hypothetical protein